MKKTLSSLTVAVIAAFAAQGAMAQAASAPARADVKKETAAANKAGTIPQGEAAICGPERADDDVEGRQDQEQECEGEERQHAEPARGLERTLGCLWRHACLYPCEVVRRLRIRPVRRDARTGPCQCVLFDDVRADDRLPSFFDRGRVGVHRIKAG